MKSKRRKGIEVVEKVAPLDKAGRRERAFPSWAHAVVVLGLLLANLALYHGTVGLGFLSVDDETGNVFGAAFHTGLVVEYGGRPLVQRRAVFFLFA